ncbi:hypothetical protein [Actinoplanes sp. NPDC051851]|uniref:hypothetical protein n=1 Tax=Actinoplanes sp. NPDC051851 TaxID=3154753 RepID=UPI0034317C80
MPSGDEALLLTRYDDVRALLTDPRFDRELSRPGAAKIGDSESGGVFNEGGTKADINTGPAT